MFFTPVFVSRVPLPPVNFLHVSTITAPLNTKVTVINLSIFCNICPSSYISNNTAALQYLTHHLGFFINKSQWELVTVPPSLCPHIFDGPWRCAVCKCQDLSPRSPHHWQPFMLCDYDFQCECEQVDTAPGRHPGIPTQDITISYGTII